MSSTRKAPEGSPVSYEKYMSSPEYAELRGIPATAVAAKAQLYLSARKRSLLFFLQSLSLKDGGMRRVARDLFNEFPERIGSPTMHSKKAKVYEGKTAEAIELELELWGYTDTPSKISASVFIEHCRRQEENLSRFLVEVCINPKLPITFSSDEKWLTEMEAEALAERDAEAAAEKDSEYSPWPSPRLDYKEPTVPYFAGIMDALKEYQERYAAKVASEFVTTTIAKQAITTLDNALALGKMTVIEGLSGSGKSTATKAWCDAHRGQARYVSLSGITHRTSFFQKVAAALGLAACQQASAKLQARIEALLASTRLMLVIDEAHYLWPQHQRGHSSPELVNWVNTALINEDVPVALICTDQFVKLKKHVEKRTGWTSEQLEHRVTEYVKLLGVPTQEDLEAVVTRLLSYNWNNVEEAWTTRSDRPVNADFVDMIVGYGITTKIKMPTVVDIVRKARLKARTDGRMAITETDINRTIFDQQIPSDQVMQYAFPDQKEEKPGRSVSVSNCKAAAARLQTNSTHAATAHTKAKSQTPGRGSSAAPVANTSRNTVLTH